MMSQAVPYLLKKWDINEGDVGMLTAMGHDETRVVPEKPLPILAKHICENLPIYIGIPICLKKMYMRRALGNLGQEKTKLYRENIVVIDYHRVSLLSLCLMTL